MPKCRRIHERVAEWGTAEETMKVIKVPDVDPPTAVLCWKQAATMERCDRRKGHGGLHVWEWKGSRPFLDPSSPEGQQVIRNSAFEQPLTQGDPPPQANPCGTESTGEPPSAPRASRETVLSSDLPSPTAPLGDAPPLEAIRDAGKLAASEQHRWAGVNNRTSQHWEAVATALAGFVLACEVRNDLAVRAAAGVGGAPEESE